MHRLINNRTFAALKISSVEHTDMIKKFSRTKPVNWLIDGNWVWLIGCILAAGIVHILAVFFLPTLATETVVQKLAEGTRVNRLYIIKPEGQLQKPLIPFLAPDIRYAFCHYDLSSGPLNVRAPLPSPGWSIAISNSFGDNFYTVTSAELKRPFLQLLIATGQQFRTVEASAAESTDEIVVVKSPEKYGVVLIRAPITSESYSDSTTKVLQRARCTPQ